MRTRETEKQRDGDSNDTEEKEDVPSLAASVKTLQEAVQLSLKDGLGENCLFTFARALKAFEITHNRRLPPTELQSAFALWWAAAKPLLPPDADRDEWRFDFENTFAKTRAPLGSNSLEEAIRRADANPLPAQAARYTSSKLKRLIAVCYHLQLLQAGSAFFLSVRDAAKITSAKGLLQASGWLTGLVNDGVLIEVEKGTRKRATRFRFKLPPPASGGEGGATPFATAVSCEVRDRDALPDSVGDSKSSGRSKPRTPTAYELVERKKALQDLIKGLGHEDHWEPEDGKQYKQLQAKLNRVNSQLAGIGE